MSASEVSLVVLLLVSSHLLVAAITCIPGEHTQEEWASRRALQWGSGGSMMAGMPIPVPMPALEPDASTSGSESSSGDCAGCTCSAPVLVNGANANVYALHGMWMTFSWSTVSVAGVYVARYCRQYPWWIAWHIKLQTVGAMGTM